HTRFKCDWSSDVCSSDLDRSSRGPAHGAAVQVGDRDLRVVERRSHVHEAVRDHATFALLLEFLLALCRRLRRRRTFRRGSRAFWFFCHDALRSFDCQILNLSKERHSIPCPPQPISLALLADGLLLGGDCAAPRTLSRSRVCMRALSANRQF